MKIWDYHTHTYLCNHASGEVEDYIRAGINRGLKEIGISDHFPMNLLPEHFHIYSMTMIDFPDHLNEIKRLKQKYQDKIVVKISSEVDYFPAAFEGYREIIKPFYWDFDYIIGSIHAVPWEGFEALPIDEKQAIPIIIELGVDKVFSEYYNSVLDMVRSNFYHVVGHLDLPKKYGLTPQNPEVIWQKVLQVLDEIEKRKMVVEINTSGLRKNIEQYPSEEMIKELIQRKIPITLGSDAHRPQDVGRDFEEIIKKIKKWGLKELYQISNQEKISVPFD
ncbi:MAG: histidinol-phosphatase HisJ [Candidatus Hodarchaeales archaeon]|jgi:histidinol-phosphatase (PHP family)